MESIDSVENQPTGIFDRFHKKKNEILFLRVDDVVGMENNFDPFSSMAKEIKTDFYRK